MLKPSALRTLVPQLQSSPASRDAGMVKLRAATPATPAAPEASLCKETPLQELPLVPPLLPRPRSIAENPSWQLLAKVLAGQAGYPQHCHRRTCRRSGKCAGGSDACYLREFEIMDVTISRILQEKGREWRAAAECGGGGNP